MPQRWHMLVGRVDIVGGGGGGWRGVGEDMCGGGGVGGRGGEGYVKSVVTERWFFVAHNAQCTC